MVGSVPQDKRNRHALQEASLQLMRAPVRRHLLLWQIRPQGDLRQGALFQRRSYVQVSMRYGLILTVQVSLCL